MRSKKKEKKESCRGFAWSDCKRKRGGVSLRGFVSSLTWWEKGRAERKREVREDFAFSLAEL